MSNTTNIVIDDDATDTREAVQFVFQYFTQLFQSSQPFQYHAISSFTGHGRGHRQQQFSSTNQNSGGQPVQTSFQWQRQSGEREVTGHPATGTIHIYLRSWAWSSRRTSLSGFQASAQHAAREQNQTFIMWQSLSSMQSYSQHRSTMSDHVGRRTVRYYGCSDQDQADDALVGHEHDDQQVSACHSHQPEAEDDLRDRDRSARRYESIYSATFSSVDEDVQTDSRTKSIVCQSPVFTCEKCLLQNSRSQTGFCQFLLIIAGNCEKKRMERSV